MAYGALDVLINPSNTNESFVGCYISGLLHIVDGKVIQIYDASNSSLETYGGRSQVNALAFGKKLKLWMLNSQSTHPLSVRTKEVPGNHFHLFKRANYRKILIDSRG